jgi:hypothetical protein
MKRFAWTKSALVVVLVLIWSQRVTLAEEKSHEHDKDFASCAKACSDCTTSCSDCYRHCLGLVIAGEKDHSKTLILCNDCAEICATAGKLTARQSPLSATVCEACAKACDECGAACAKFPQDKHMSDCAKTCHDCAAACREMIKHISG